MTKYQSLGLTLLNAGLVYHLHQIRFINSIENLDQNIAWENVKTARNIYLSKYNQSSCNYLLPNKNIRENIERFMKLANTSSSYLQKNLTKEDINGGAKMFLYLNSCPNNGAIKNHTLKYFGRVFKKYHDEPTNSGMVLYTLNAMKLFSNDGRIIASKILEKITTLFKLSFISSQNAPLLALDPEGNIFSITYISINHQTSNVHFIILSIIIIPLILVELSDLTKNFVCIKMHLNCLDDEKIYSKSSNHPVHILNREGKTSPSSLIPFCAFGNDMKRMGRGMNGFHDPVCDSFEEKIRKDQLCYEVDLEKYKDNDEDKIKKQLESGLVLILDYNLERQSKMHNPIKSSENDVHIYLDTISKFQ